MEAFTTEVYLIKFQKYMYTQQLNVVINYNTAGNGHKHWTQPIILRTCVVLAQNYTSS